MKRILFILFISLISNLSFAQVGIRYTSSNLNLRYGPGTNYEVIGVVPKGTMVTIDEDCNCSWVPVEYNGMVGYISTSYLVKGNNEQNKVYPLSPIKVNEFNLLLIIMRLQLEQPHYVEMERIVSVEADAELVRITVVWRGGYKQLWQYV